MTNKHDEKEWWSFVQDGDGHDYLIPSRFHSLFYKMLDEGEDKNDFSEFIDMFDSYRMNGSSKRYEFQNPKLRE